MVVVTVLIEVDGKFNIFEREIVTFVAAAIG
jgi:hypothetical protein